MTALLKHRMTVDEFIVWAQARHDEPKWELFDGALVMQNRQEWQHIAIKTEVYLALRRAIGRANLPYFAVPDGATVQIDKRTAYGPDALVAPLPEPAPHDLIIANPVIVVEVLSPSSMRRDLSDKLAGYFRVASIQHYLVIDPDDSTVIHHQRGSGGLLPPQVLHDGVLKLEPPGIEISIEEMFGSS